MTAINGLIIHAILRTSIWFVDFETTSSLGHPSFWVHVPMLPVRLTPNIFACEIVSLIRLPANTNASDKWNQIKWNSSFRASSSTRIFYSLEFWWTMSGAFFVSAAYDSDTDGLCVWQLGMLLKQNQRISINCVRLPRNEHQHSAAGEFSSFHRTNCQPLPLPQSQFESSERNCFDIFLSFRIACTNCYVEQYI